MAVSLVLVNPNGNPTGSYLSGRAISDNEQIITITEAVYSAPYYWESNDGGVTWAGKTGYPAPDGYPNYVRIAASADGSKKISVGNYGKAYRTLDGGQTWTVCAPGGSTASRYFSSAAISADGSVMLICVQNGRAYKSSNSGASWVEVQPAGAANKYWNVAGISDDGQVMILGIGDALAGRAYISTNGGTSWALLDPNGYGDNLKWTSAALSADGNVIVLTASTGNACFISTNKGVSWRYAWPPTGSYDGVNRSFYSAAVSGDGSKIMVGGMLSSSLMPFLYLSEDGGASWTDVTPEGCGAGQCFVAVHINRVGTAGYAAQTAGGRCWVFTFRAGNAEVDVPSFESETKIAGAGIAYPGNKEVPKMEGQSSLMVTVFSGWEQEVAPCESQSNASSAGGGFAVLQCFMGAVASFLANFIVVQAEVQTKAMAAESWLYPSSQFSGKWTDVPKLGSQSKLDVIVAPGWHEIRPAGSAVMPIIGYYPSNDGRVALSVAASDWYFVSRTLDGGETWETVPDSNFEGQGIALCAVSGDGRTMFVCGSDYSNPLFVISRDYGRSWKRVPIVQTWSGGSIAMSDDGQVILVCGAMEKAHPSKGYISRDNGQTWQRIYPMGHINTANGTTEIDECWKFAISGNGQVIFAASKDLWEFDPGSGQYVKLPNQTWYASRDGGVTWERMPTLYDETSHATEMALSYDGNYGLFSINNKYVSDPSPFAWWRIEYNGGWNFEQINPGFAIDWNHPWYCASDMKPGPSEKLLVGEMWDGRLWFSENGGASYVELRPAGDANIFWKKVWIKASGRLIADGFNPYVTPQRRILYMSDDNGQNWLPEVTGRMGYLGWGACAMSGDGVVMLAGRNGGSIHMSRDKGGTWAEIPPGFGMDRQWAAIDISADGSKILVGSNHEMEGARVWISRDRGDNWAEVELPEKEMDQFPAVGMSRDGQHMLAAYASTYAPGYVVYSDDGGQNWRRVWPKGSSIKAGWDWVRAFNGGLLLVGIDEWIYRSFDGGNTWTRTNIAQNTDHNSIVGLCGNENGAILYAGVFRGRVWRSFDYGDTWEEVRIKGDLDGLWYGLSCNSAAGYLLFADNGGRVWKSKDSGQTWVDQRVCGDRNSNWSGTAIDETGEVMLACTDDHLFYAYDIVRPGGEVYIVDIIGGMADESMMTGWGLKGFAPAAEVLESISEMDSQEALWKSFGAQYRYRCFLKKDGLEDQEIPCSSMQCTLNATGRSYVSVVVPGIEGLADLLQQFKGGNVATYWEAVNPDGAVIRWSMAQAVIDSIRVDVGPGNRNATINGYFDAAGPAEYRAVRTVYESIMENGKRLWRIADRPMGLRAGNILVRAWDGGEMTTERITINISAARVQIDATGL